MNHQTFYFGNPASLNSDDEQQALAHLRALMHELNARLPQLPPQYDALMGNALLNLALMKFMASHGQEATANLLAGAAEYLWSDGWRELDARPVCN